MVVRFDFERRAPAVAEIDDAGVLTRRNNHPFARGWQPLQMYSRRLVRAMLGPHDREDAEFREGRFAAKQLFDALEFLLSEIVGGDNFRSDHYKERLLYL